MSFIPTGARAKAFGAFYTARSVADFLVRWSVRDARSVIMDPSFGGGVFLEAALEHIQATGGPPSNIYGVELDAAAHASTSEALHQRYALPCSQLRQDDLFALSSQDLPPFDAIVGNPPYIRYQRFSGHHRALALERAREQGVTLSNLASAWATFLVHSTSFLKAGGRLAMVLPMELMHAQYAQPVLEHLKHSFEWVTLLTFRERLFPNLDQDTLLLLAEGKGPGGNDIRWRDFGSFQELLAFRQEDPFEMPELRSLPTASSAKVPKRLQRHFLPEHITNRYDHLAGRPGVQRLGDVVHATTGYVTGSNAFFHLSCDEVSRWQLPAEFLQRTLFRGGALKGLRLTDEDWHQATLASKGGYLLALPRDGNLPAAVQAYLAHGEEQRVHEAFKCRHRTPWYCVPNVRQPDLFLTSMNGARPLLVTNEAKVSASNTLHILHMKPRSDLPPVALSISWLSSLTHLSAELEGRVMGGGMLKLEPSDARRVLLALPPMQVDMVTLADTLDGLLRQGRFEDAQYLADEVLLKEGLGLSHAEIQAMNQATATLRDRRCR